MINSGSSSNIVPVVLRLGSLSESILSIENYQWPAFSKRFYWISLFTRQLVA